MEPKCTRKFIDFGGELSNLICPKIIFGVEVSNAKV